MQLNEIFGGDAVNIVLAIMGALGGLAVFLTAIVAIVRSVVRQVGATEDNTRALKDVRDALNNQGDQLIRITSRLDNHAERIASLEGGRHPQ